MKKLATALGILLSVFSMQAAWAANVWLHNTKVKNIYPYSDASFVITFTTDQPLCTNPQTPKYYYVAVGQNGVNVNLAKSILSVAMMSMSLDIPVGVIFDTATSMCYVSAISTEN